MFCSRSSKIYLFYDVNFFENSFPYQNIFSNDSATCKTPACEGSNAANQTPFTIFSPPLSHDLLSSILIPKAGTTNSHQDTISSACAPKESPSPGNSSTSPKPFAASPDNIDFPLPQSSTFPNVYIRRNRTVSSVGQAHPTASIPLQPSLEPVQVTTSATFPSSNNSCCDQLPAQHLQTKKYPWISGSLISHNHPCQLQTR